MRLSRLRLQMFLLRYMTTKLQTGVLYNAPRSLRRIGHKVRAVDNIGICKTI